MSAAYDPEKDGRESYALAIQIMRRKFLAERLPGESAKDWIKRTERELKT